jgi:hypothetical protein
VLKSSGSKYYRWLFTNLVHQSAVDSFHCALAATNSTDIMREYSMFPPDLKKPRYVSIILLAAIVNNDTHIIDEYRMPLSTYNDCLYTIKTGVLKQMIESRATNVLKKTLAHISTFEKRASMVPLGRVFSHCTLYPELFDVCLEWVEPSEWTCINWGQAIDKTRRFLPFLLDKLVVRGNVDCLKKCEAKFAMFPIVYSDIKDVAESAARGGSISMLEYMSSKGVVFTPSCYEYARNIETVSWLVGKIGLTVNYELVRTALHQLNSVLFDYLSRNYSSLFEDQNELVKCLPDIFDKLNRTVKRLSELGIDLSLEFFEMYKLSYKEPYSKRHKEAYDGVLKMRIFTTFKKLPDDAYIWLKDNDFVTAANALFEKIHCFPNVILID